MDFSIAAAVATPGNAATQAPTATAATFDQVLDGVRQQRSGALIDPLMSLNRHSATLAAQVERLQGPEMKPSELMMLTMRSHEFLFHCELVSNVANRSSDGVQQLFRQQS